MLSFDHSRESPTMLRRRQFNALLSTAGVSAVTLRAANAQTSTPIRMLVGFAPGGTADVIARAIAEGMRPSGINCVVDNRPGAGGRLATNALLSAPADGTTIMLAPSTNLTLFPHLYPDLRSKVAELAYLGVAAEVQFGFAVHHDSGPKTLAEFLDRARKDSRNAFYGTPGAGSVMQLLGDLLGRRAKVPLASVPYKGGSAAVNEVIGGTLPAVLTALPNLMPMHKAGKLRILAVSADKALPTLPEVPTFSAVGFPDLTASEYMCLVARKGVPPAFVERMNAALTTAVRTPSVAPVMERLGFQQAGPISPDALAKRISADTARWQLAVKETGFKAVE